MTGNFELTYLEKATQALKAVLIAFDADPKNDFLRDASIQRFEFTYELAHKTLKRYLELTEPSPLLIEQMSFPDLIRTASEKGLLLSGWDTWVKYRHARNLSSHTYDEKKAIEVCKVIPFFLAEIETLLKNLKTRINS